MALNIKPGTLLKGTVFKMTGAERYKLFDPGHAVRFSRSPVDPGAFVVWADYGLHWYVKVPAVQLPTLVQPKE